ncbi:MAG: DMT family transporter [Patescibacteria group bacterium]
MKNKGLILVLTTAIISGFSIYFNKFAIKMNSPYIFAGLKNLIVGIFFIALTTGVGQLVEFRKLKKQDWLKLVLIGLIGGSIPFLLFFQGLSMTTAASASFIHKTMFLWVGLLAIWFLKEKLNKNLWIAILSILVGNVLLLKMQNISLNWGDGLILLATLFWAAEITYSKKVLTKLSPRMVSFGRMFFGSLFILAFLAVTGQLTLIGSLSTAQWGWVMFTSVFLIGYVGTFYHGLKWVKASTATAILALGAPITAVLQAIFSHQILINMQWLGLGLIGLGTAFFIVQQIKTNGWKLPNN